MTNPHIDLRRERQEAILRNAPFFLRPEWGDAMRDSGVYRGDAVLEVSLADGQTVRVRPRNDSAKGAVGTLIGATEEVHVLLHVDTSGEVSGLELPHIGDVVHDVDSMSVVTDDDLTDVA